MNPFAILFLSLLNYVLADGVLDHLDIFSEFPVKSLLNENVCAEPVWCKDSYTLQQRVYEWQNPSQEKCKTSKFLIYDPPNIGIGAMLHLTIDAMNIAMNSGRILYFRRNVGAGALPWQSSKCASQSWECYFAPITSCSIDESKSYPEWRDDTISTLQTNGNMIARIGQNKYSRPAGPALWCTQQGANGKLPEWFLAGITHREAFLIEAMVMAQFARYLFRPL